MEAIRQSKQRKMCAQLTTIAQGFMFMVVAMGLRLGFTFVQLQLSIREVYSNPNAYIKNGYDIKQVLEIVK